MSVLRLSANLGFLWPELPLLERIDAAAAGDFGAIELHWPYDVPAAAVRERCRRRDLTLLGINTSRGDVAASEFGLGALPGREADFQASFDQALAYALEAGAGAIHCMAGTPAPDQREASRASFLANLRAASAKARPHGITLLLEPLNPHDAPGYFFHEAAEGASVIAEAGVANLRLMFDCYHVGRSEGAVVATLEQVFGVVGHVQIAAVPSRAEPDRGELDYRTVFQALDRLGYAGWVGCEYKPAGDTDEGLRWLGALGLRP